MRGEPSTTHDMNGIPAEYHIQYKSNTCLFDFVGKGINVMAAASPPSHFCELPHVLPQATDLQLQTEGLDGDQHAAKVPEARVPGGDKP